MLIYLLLVILFLASLTGTLVLRYKLIHNTTANSNIDLETVHTVLLMIAIVAGVFLIIAAGYIIFINTDYSINLTLDKYLAEYNLITSHMDNVDNLEAAIEYNNTVLEAEAQNNSILFNWFVNPALLKLPLIK